MRFTKWKPESPDVARIPNAGSKVEWQVPTEIDESGNIDWQQAPPLSHVDRFAFQDARKLGFFKKFGNNESVILVIFKGDAKRGPSQYAYYFKDHARAEAIFTEMLSSPHPYSLVVYPKLRLAKVPYKPLAIGAAQ